VSTVRAMTESMTTATTLRRPPQGHCSASVAKPGELMHTSNLWLGPFQGLAASALGVLLVTRQKKDGSEPSVDKG